MRRLISKEVAITILRHLSNSEYHWEYDRNKHHIAIEIEGCKAYFRLPIHMDMVTNFTSYYDMDDDIPYVIILIQAGKAAVAYFEGDLLVDHKVFKSYMVRQKQGKSQIKYLNAKGKSKAGSRVRLANTVHFFESINERLIEYFEDYEVQRRALSCSKTLLPYLYSSKVECPFEKNDDRIVKIPKHVHTPGYEILLETSEWIMQGELKVEDENESVFEELISWLDDAAAT